MIIYGDDAVSAHTYASQASATPSSSSGPRVSSSYYRHPCRGMKRPGSPDISRPANSRKRPPELPCGSGADAPPRSVMDMEPPNQRYLNNAAELEMLRELSALEVAGEPVVWPAGLTSATAQQRLKEAHLAAKNHL